MLDYETNQEHSITVLVTSSDGSTDTQSFTINVLNVNDNPVVVTDSDATANEINENTSNGSTVGVTGLGVDGDTGTTITNYALTDDADGRFTIDAAGVVTVADADAIISSDGSYSITIEAISSDGSVNTADFVIDVVANDPPIAQANTVSALEDTEYVFNTDDFTFTDAQGDALDSITIESLEANGSLRYDDGTGFRDVVIGDTISAADIAAGNLVFVPFPEASGSNYDAFTFTVNDGQDSSTAAATMTIDVAAVNDSDISPLTDSDASANVVQAGSGSGVYVGVTGFADDIDTEDTVTYSFDNNTLTSDDGRFVIDPNTGEVTTTGTDIATTGSHSFTLRATSTDGSSDDETFTVDIVNAEDDFAVVHESALDDGTGSVETVFDSQGEIDQDVANGEGTIVATGNLLANDVGASSITDIAGGTLNNGVYTVSSEYGTLVVDLSGNYTYTLNGSADHSGVGEDVSLVDQFSYTSDVGGPSNLNITIVDDVTIVTDVVANVAELETQSYNLVFTLDVSGSMANNSGTINFTDGSSLTRLDIAQESLISLAEEYFSQSDAVSISFITFSTDATLVGTYTDLASFSTAVNSTTAGGGTNYELALAEVVDVLDSDGDGDIDNTTDTTITYFLSDGNPTSGDTVSPEVSSGWSALLDNPNNTIDSIGVGIGTGISDTQYLDAIHNVDADGSGEVDGAVIVPDLRNLESELLSTVPASFGGSVLLSGNVSTVEFGADGGFVQNIEIMVDSDGDNIPDTLVTFSYDPTENAGAGSITNDGGYGDVAGSNLTLNDSTGFVYGTLIFQLDTGDYTYYAASSVEEGDTFSLDFTASDNDGDTNGPATLTINIVDGEPVANNDTDTLFGNSSELEGNVISGIGTDSGVSLGEAFTSFATQGAGVDNGVDNAQVTSINYRGDNIDLTVDSSGTNVFASNGSGAYDYTVVDGELTITNSDSSSLVFNSAGYYSFTPTIAPGTITHLSDLTVRDILGLFC